MQLKLMSRHEKRKKEKEGEITTDVDRALIAQLVVHLFCKQEVMGSTPI